MTTTNHPLPAELIFEPDGHLAGAALACVADGELDLVPAGALDHLDHCDRCARLLGEAALLSIAAREALASVAVTAQLAPAPLAVALQAVPVLAALPRKARRPLPVAAIAAALALAVLAAGPAIIDSVESAPDAIAGAVASAPFLARVAMAFLRGAPWGLGSLPLLLEGVSALVLVAVGLQVARVTSRSSSWQQGGVG
jgi:hypothetical protein